ncbi:MAG: site-specific DNA-methyltransferase [Spirochaetaceae bacterium]|jgi:adenine-specific DNA-methyltransferase|nr:site-specific DNA-methyltransferase [Spirochaetaceae bacterium]
MPKKTDNPEKRAEIEAYAYGEHARANIPAAGLAQYDTAQNPDALYQYDPHLDPTLQWTGKTEGNSFKVQTSSIHIHESIKPHKIIRSIKRDEGAENSGQETEASQGWLFESDAERAKRKNDAIEFYQHKDKWTNRLIAGDSLVIMNSLLEKEGMHNQIQMIYIDPPYGIKYGSNFQPFVNKRDVKDKKDEDLSTEPETIKAFRDTWELGIHSYLSYLRNRLLLTRELLHESGSVFVQISDENVHHVRELCDEVFGAENFISMIIYKKGGFATANELNNVADFIIWYAKDKTQIKYHQLHEKKEIGKGETIGERYDQLESPDGKIRRPMTMEEKENPSLIPDDWKAYQLSNACSQHDNPKHREQPILFEGKEYFPPFDRQWSVAPEKMYELIKNNRIVSTGKNLAYVRYLDDYPVIPINNIWTDFLLRTTRIYVVQTAEKAIARCLLMSTDPGDLVLDITCGSGTTAYVAEQWGRRWITCDTSRVAVTLAKKRLMTAVYPYYKITSGVVQTDSRLAASESSLSDPSKGFEYKTVPHITLKSIANNEAAERETLYDQPLVDKGKVRIAGPFTVEALPAPVVFAVDANPRLERQVEAAEAGENPFAELIGDDFLGAFTRAESSAEDTRNTGAENHGHKLADWAAELASSGILGRGGERIHFSRVEAMPGAQFLHAEAETAEKTPRRAVICFGSETNPLDTRTVDRALEEAAHQYPRPAFVIFAYFQADPQASNVIEKANLPGVTILKAQMNTDLMTADLKKKSSSSQSFWLVGQPDVELIRLDIPDGKTAKVSPASADSSKTRTYKVRVLGFDYYDVKKGVVESGGAERIAMWMLDADYDGMAIEPQQVFFPMEGKNEGWDKLAKTLRAEIDPDLIEQYRGVESLPFAVKENSLIAVKIVDDRGIESLKVIPIPAEE